MADNTLGRWVWYDLLAAKPDVAKSFYPKVVGWGTTVWDGPMPYTMWTRGESGPLGGIMDIPAEAKESGAPSHWLGYVSTPDCAGTAAKAVKLGGKVMHEPTDIPEIGTFAILQDPQGAVFAIFQAAGDTPEDAPPEVEQFSWHELATTDYEAAFEFYSQLFDWSVTEEMDMGDAGKYRMYGFGKWPLGGMFNKPAEIPVPTWLYYVRVPDVNEAMETVKTAGGKVMNGPMEVPGGDLIAHCMDPQGAAFALHSTASQ